MLKKVAERLTSGIKRFQPVLTNAKSKDVNESDTVIIITDMLAWLRTYDKVRSLVTDAGLLFPGHDLRMTGTDPLVPRLATVVAPSLLHIDWRRPHDDDLLALVTVERENGASTTFRIVPGGLMRFPLRPGERAMLTVHPMRENDFGAGPGKVWRGNVVGGLLGLVFDARGRPVALPADAKVRQAKLLEWLDTLEGGRSGWAGEQV